MKLKPSRWMAGVCFLSGGFCMSLPAATPTSAAPASQEAIKDFRYTPAISTPPAVFLPAAGAPTLDTSTPELVAAAKTPPAKMNSLRVRGSSATNRDYRELNQEVTRGPLTAARAFFTTDLRNGAQLEAIGAPLFPIAGENATHQDQARFPLFGINW